LASMFLQMFAKAFPLFSYRLFMIDPTWRPRPLRTFGDLLGKSLLQTLCATTRLLCWGKGKLLNPLQ